MEGMLEGRADQEAGTVESGLVVAVSAGELWQEEPAGLADAAVGAGAAVAAVLVVGVALVLCTVAPWGTLLWGSQ